MLAKRALIFFTLLFPLQLAVAQTSRVTTTINRARTGLLTGSRHPMARSASDQGLMDLSITLHSLSMNFGPSPEQQADLNQLLVDQQDPLSPSYHLWLTPEEFADRFGLSQSDIDTAATWLRSEGFTINDVARGRTWIGFSGTAGQVLTTFKTQIHTYSVDGEMHFANASAISIPEALLPVVLSVTGLDDFTPHSLARLVEQKAKPEYTAGSFHYLSPDDYATIYNIRPLYNSGFDGTGQKLAIIGRSDVNLSDIQQFRNTYGLSTSNLPVKILVPGTVNPGTSNSNDVGESLLDLEWSGATARNATIYYVYSPDVELSLRYAIDQNIAPVISFSYGRCEIAGAEPALPVYAQRAAAQGITWLVSSGDSGAAMCDRSFSGATSQYGLTVSIFAALPEVTGVGGTQFNEGNGSYWSTSNSTSGGSAISYIPETAWNESGTNGLASTGGGLSIFQPKPAWQVAVGVPAGNARAVPDVSMSAAGHDGYRVVKDGGTLIYSGTSAASPSLAGLIAILNQYTVAKGFQTKPGLGNINPTLYRLFQTTPNAFHDITSGDNIVPCFIAPIICPNGFIGYTAGPGYDLATGLGSIDANNLVTQWNGKVLTTTTTLSANPTAFNTAANTVFTATVSPVGSSTAPAGTVTFGTAGKTLGSVTLTASGATATAALTVAGSQFSVGPATVTASYGGNATFNSSSGSVTVVASLPTSGSAIVPIISPSPVYQQTPDSSGYSWFYSITLTETAGVATTLTGFTIGGTSYTASIASFFGTGTIPARGSIVAHLGTKGLTPPVSLVFAFTGADANARSWSQQVSASFNGPQFTAAMNLISAPGAVSQNPAAAAGCQWYQHLGVEELNGHPVQLTRFLAGGQNLSTQIAGYFGSTTLPALGTLLTGVCWTGISPPETLDYELDGTDDTGTLITTTLSVPFTGPPSAVSVLGTSKTSAPLSVASASQSTSTTISVNVPAGIPWTVSAFPSNRTTSWLTVSPRAGTGTGTLTIAANGLGLLNSTYKATVTIQSSATVPQFIDVPVTFVIGSGTSQVTVNTGGAVSNASYAGPISAGSLISIFGTNFSTTTSSGFSIPLPTSYNGTSVAINGIPSPLLFVSPGQINAQVPFETASGPGNVVVTAGGSSGSTFATIATIAPAIFADSKTRANAHYNSGGAAVTPSNPASAGNEVVIYGTGTGPLSSPPGTGLGAGSGSSLARCVANVGVTMNAVPATVNFCGLTSGFVGLMQINAVVPPGLPAGDVTLVVFINGVAAPKTIIAVSGR